MASNLHRPITRLIKFLLLLQQQFFEVAADKLDFSDFFREKTHSTALQNFSPALTGYHHMSCIVQNLLAPSR